THIGDASADALRHVKREAQAADPNHVAALLVVRVRIEEIVGDILEDALEEGTGELGPIYVGVRDRRLVEDVLDAYLLSRQQRRSPAESRRECDLRVTF